MIERGKGGGPRRGNGGRDLFWGGGDLGVMSGTAVVMEMEDELGNWEKEFIFLGFLSLPTRDFCRRVWGIAMMETSSFSQVIVDACPLGKIMCDFLLLSFPLRVSSQGLA